MFGALEQGSGFHSIRPRRNSKRCEGSVASKLSLALDAFQRSFDATLELQPFKFRGAADSPKGKNEAVRDCGGQEALG